MKEERKAQRLLTLGGLVLASLVCLTPPRATAQQPIPTGATPYTQDFSIGTNAQANMPSNWKIDRKSDARTVGDFSSAGVTTARRAGNSMTSSAPSGVYNFGAGPADTATDRAPGWLFGGVDGGRTGNLYVHLINDTSTPLNGLVLSYDIEKYRNGTSVGGFCVQLYYSSTGSAGSWISAGTDFCNTYEADADNNGFASAPGSTTNVVNKQLSVVIPAGQSLYLAWSCSAISGNSGNTSQCHGIDNVSILGRPLVVSGNSAASVKSSPVSLGGNVYFGNNAGEVRSVAAATNTENWTFNVNANGASGTSQTLGRPALYNINGTYYLFLTTNDGYVFCLDAATGAKVWSVGPLVAGATTVDTTPAALTRSTLAGTSVYVPVYTGADGYVFKLKGDDGSTLKTSPDLITAGSGGKLSSPSAAGGGVYVTATGGDYAGYRLSPSDLSTLVGLASGKNSGTPPFIHQYSGVVYPRVLVTASDGTLSAYNASNGTVQYENVDVTPSATTALTLPVAYDEVVYMAGANGIVYRANVSDGSAAGGNYTLYSGASGNAIQGMALDPSGIGGAPTLLFGAANGSFYKVPIANPANAVVIAQPAGSSPYATTPSIDTTNALVQAGNDNGNVYSFMRN